MTTLSWAWTNTSPNPAGNIWRPATAGTGDIQVVVNDANIPNQRLVTQAMQQFIALLNGMPQTLPP